MATTNEHPSTTSPVSSQWTAERTTVLEAARAMYRDGLVVGSSGNVSSRCGKELLAITTSGKDYGNLELDQIVVVDFDGEPIVGDGVPSSEMLMHTAIYRARPGVGAVMHTHSVYASALAVAGLSIPAIIDEMVVYLGDRIQMSAYASPGSEEMGEQVVAALGERSAALIKNHGLVGVGSTPADALRVCQMAERIAHIYTLAKTLGNVDPLPPEAVETELELFRMRQAVQMQLAGEEPAEDQR